MRLTRISSWLLLAATSLPLAVAAAAQTSSPLVVGNFSHPQYADGAIFSPDGRVLAATSYSGGVTLWDLSSGLPLRTLMARAHLTGTVFTSDGKRILTAHKDGALRIWDSEAGAVLQALRVNPHGDSAEPEPIIGLGIDRTAEHAITFELGPRATMWSLTARKKLFALPRAKTDNLARTQRIIDSSISADCKRLTLLAGSIYNKRDSAGTYDARTGAELSFFDLPENHVAVENGFVGDDEAIVLVFGAACPAGELMLFSLKDRAVTAPVLRPALCDKPKDEQPKPFRLHASRDSGRVAISRDGDPDLRVFDTASRKIVHTLRLPDGPAARVLGVSRDLKHVAIATDDRVVVRALDTGALLQTLRGFAAPVDRITFGAGGTAVAVQLERAHEGDAAVTVGLRALRDVQGAVFRLALPAGLTIRDFAIAPRLALASGDRPEIMLLSLDGKHEPRTIALSPLKSVALVRLSPDGRSAVIKGYTEDSGEGEAVFLVDLASGTMRPLEVGNPETFVTSIAFSADGALFAIGLRDGSAELFETASARRLKKLPPYKEDGDVGALAFSSDGALLAGGATFDDSAFVWNIGTGKPARTIALPDSLAGYRIVTAVALSHDRRTLAAGLGQRARSSGDIGPETGGVLLFDLPTGKLRFALRNHRAAVTALAFSQDDRTLVSASYDGTVRSFDRATGKSLATAAIGADGHWAVLTEAGFYAAPDGAGHAVGLVRGSRALPAAAVQKLLSRPDLVAGLLRGDPDGKYRAAAKILDLSKAAPAR